MGDYFVYFMLWSQIFFHLSISSCRAWTVLWFLLFHTYLNDWGSNLISSNSYGFFRICITLRSSILLRGDGNHKSFLRYPLYRGRPGSMNMRRICSTGLPAASLVLTRARKLATKK